MTSGELMRPVAQDDAPAALQLALVCLMIAAGGLLLGLQVDGTGSLVGTGYTSLGIGAVVALLATLTHTTRAGYVPRDTIGMFSAVCGFFGLAFAVSGVLAPGGGWMFFEVLLLVGILVRRGRSSETAGPELSSGVIAVLILMLLFRLWISYQGSEHRWEVMLIEVPVLAWMPFEFLDPLKTVSLGSFTPHELGFPPTGIDFPVSMTLWSTGFALCVIGMRWRAHASTEHENDRIHATIHELPPGLSHLVESLLPEDEWQPLGLHGLSVRQRRKKISALIVDKLAQRQRIEGAMRSSQLLTMTSPGGFAGEIHEALSRHELPRPGGGGR